MSEFANLSHLDVTCALIAAICHDYKHDGYNNQYHAQIKSERVKLYGEVGVQEQFHFAESWKVVEDVDLLGFLTT